MADSTELIRVGVVGDVHAQDRALERALRFLEGQRLDRLLCVGDVVDGEGDADRCIELLMEARVDTVAGNHERWALHHEHRDLPNATLELREESREHLLSLPPVRRYATPKGPFLLCHGVGTDDMAFLRPDTQGYALQDMPSLRDLMLDPEVSYAVGGHTHQRMVRRFQGLTFVNAGTLLPDEGPCVLVIDFEAASCAFYDASVERAFELLEDAPLPEPAPLPDF